MDGLNQSRARRSLFQVGSGHATAGVGAGASGTVDTDLSSKVGAIATATAQADAQDKVDAAKEKVDDLLAAAETEVGSKQTKLTTAQKDRDAVSGICLARVVHMQTRLATYPLLNIAAPAAGTSAVTQQLYQAYVAAKREATDYRKEKGDEQDYHEVRIAMLWAHARLLSRVCQGLADGKVAENVAVLMLAMVVQQRDMAPVFVKDGVRDDLKDLTTAPDVDTVMRSGVVRAFGGVGKSASINNDELTQAWRKRVTKAQLALATQPNLNTANTTGQTQWQALLTLETTLRNRLWFGETQYIGIPIADALDIIARTKHECITEGQRRSLDGEGVNLIVQENFQGLTRPSELSVRDNDFVQALAAFGDIAWGDHAWHKQVGRLNAQQLADQLKVEAVSDTGLANIWRNQVIAQECDEIACLDNTTAQAHIALRVAELQQVKALDEIPEGIALQQPLSAMEGQRPRRIVPGRRG